jgi:hypothetical protein
MIIEYCADGPATSDFDVEDTVLLLRQFQDVPDVHLLTSSGILIDAIRLAVVKDELRHDSIQFMYNMNLYSVNTYGVIQDWPNGFADKSVDIAQMILTLVIKKRKENRR